MAEHLPPVLIQAFEKRTVRDAAKRTHPLDSNISQSEAELLYEMVRKLRPERSVEVGLAKGVSALAILQACNDNGRGTHHIIDPFQHEYGDCGLAMIERAGLHSRMKFHRRVPEEVIPDLDPVDFAFIDASHLFDLTMVEFVLVDKKLRPGGVVGFHDLWMTEQRKLVRYILRNRRYSVAKANRPRKTLKKRITTALRKLPLAEDVLAPNLLHPYGTFCAGNLVFLRKEADDHGRSWKHFRQFSQTVSANAVIQFFSHAPEILA